MVFLSLGKKHLYSITVSTAIYFEVLNASSFGMDAQPKL